jgi:hypothetical protein
MVDSPKPFVYPFWQCSIIFPSNHNYNSIYFQREWNIENGAKLIRVQWLPKSVAAMKNGEKRAILKCFTKAGTHSMIPDFITSNRVREIVETRFPTCHITIWSYQNALEEYERHWPAC